MRDLVANLVWCGKESALEVLRAGLRGDMRSVEVSFRRGEAAGGWAPMTVRAVVVPAHSWLSERP